MNREQRRLLELLNEFDSICKENEIQYCLGGETLLYGFCYGHLEPRPCFASVIMDAANAKRFIKLAGKYPEHRELEYWGNSEMYPDYSMRYVASDTTAFNILDFFKYRTHGMWIEIQILRSSKKSVRKIRLLESGIKMSSKNAGLRTAKIKGKKNKLVNVYYKLMCVFKGKAGVRKLVFDYLIKNRAKPVIKATGVGGRYDFINAGKKLQGVSEYYFNRLDSCEIEGCSFPIPSNTRALLAKLYDNRYSYTEGIDHVIDNFRFIENCIIDIDSPYAEVIKHMGIERKEIAELISSRHRIEELNRLNNPNNILAAEDWVTVIQTDARFRMWKHYMPLKEELLKLYDGGKGDFDEIDRYFRAYTKELRALRPHNRSFAFDQELFDIYIEMLERRGEFEEADRVYSQLPISHFEIIEMSE